MRAKTRVFLMTTAFAGAMLGGLVTEKIGFHLNVYAVVLGLYVIYLTLHRELVDGARHEQ